MMSRFEYIYYTYWPFIPVYEGDNGGWDGWMASPTRWMWVWVNSRSWWWTGRPGVLQFMGLQRVGHDWATELTDWLNWSVYFASYAPINVIYPLFLFMCIFFLLIFLHMKDNCLFSVLQIIFFQFGSYFFSLI